MPDPHGNTPAGWTTVSIILLAFLIGSVSVAVGNWLTFWIGGVGLAVVGVIVGKVMQMMGLGQVPKSRARAGEGTATSS